MTGASVEAIVVGNAVGGAVGGAVQGAGNKAIVEGSRDSEEILSAARHGAEVGAVTGAIAGFVGAPQSSEFAQGGVAAVTSEMSAVLDTAKDVLDVSVSGEATGTIPALKSNKEE
jgi:hypothetical protein